MIFLTPPVRENIEEHFNPDSIAFPKKINFGS